MARTKQNMFKALKFLFFGSLIILFINLVSAAQSCQTYDNFSSSALNTSKWDIRQDPEGQLFMDEYWLDNVSQNYHTQQNTTADRRIYLVPKRNFTTGDSIIYDVNVVSKEGNYGSLVLLTGDQYVRFGIVGYNNGPQPVDELGVTHVEITFYDAILSLIKHYPSGQNHSQNFLLNNVNGTYQLYIGSFTGHNGLAHIDYDNFNLCTFSVGPPIPLNDTNLTARIEVLEQKVAELENITASQEARIVELENKVGVFETIINKIIDFIKKLPRGLSKDWSD